MPMTFFIPNKNKISYFLKDAGWGKLAINSFYPSGRPISLHQLHRSPFAVVNYSFMNYFFASSIARAGWRVSTCI